MSELINQLAQQGHDAVLELVKPPLPKRDALDVIEQVIDRLREDVDALNEELRNEGL